MDCKLANGIIGPVGFASVSVNRYFLLRDNPTKRIMLSNTKFVLINKYFISLNQ